MLDDRKAQILRAVIEQYIETAQPVGSSRIAKRPGIDVSSATVRNDLHVLEDEGYLHQPHTSAGRVPTDKGYRFYVDDLEPGSIRTASASSQQIRRFFDQAHGELEQMLADTSSLLSRLTNYASVVVSEGPEHTTVRSVQLVGLTGRLVLVVTVLSNGVINKHTIELPDEVDEARLGVATAHLSRHLDGLAVGGSFDVPRTNDDAVDALVDEALSAMSSDESLERVFVGGTARMAEAFDAVDTVRKVLATLEKQFVVVSLVRDVLDRGDHVAIGTEHGVEPLADCSVVVAPFEVDGEPAGSIGVLGPTRMHYPEALAAVAMVSQRLGRRLTEG